MNEKEEIKINHYLTFMLGEETFASHVNHVTKILEMQKITEVPRAPKFMKGVINLRGNVLPVIDGRIKFGLTPKPYTDKTCILVLSIKLEGEQIEVGAIVDAVLDVIEFPQEDIKPSPALGSKYKSDFIDGVIKRNEKFLMILNMDSVFSAQEIIEIQAGDEATTEESPQNETPNTNQNQGE